MKKTVIFTILAVAIGAGLALTPCDSRAAEKKAEPAKAAEARPASKDCGDCPMGKKLAGKSGKTINCPDEAKDGGRAAAEGKAPEAAEHKHDGKPCDCCKEHGKDKTGTETKAAKKFACPMNCATSDKPGKCPKCGMLMKEKAKAVGKFACPMNCATSDKPGKCPKCGMAMVEKK